MRERVAPGGPLMRSLRLPPNGKQENKEEE